MKNFDEIENLLDNIISTTHRILELNKQQPDNIEAINKLMQKREKQLQTLFQSHVNKHELTERQKDKFRNFFSQFYVMGKKLDRLFTELSLNLKSKIQEIELQKKARKAYQENPSTNKFLNAQIQE